MAGKRCTIWVRFQGILTLFFASKVGPDGHVVAFEPHPLNYRRVMENVELNRLSNVTVRSVAIRRESAELELVAPGAALPDGRAQARGRGQDLESMGFTTQTFRVPVVFLDEAIAANSLPAPDLVKIDVEGLELDVLQGMSETIAARKPRLFVEIHGIGAEAKRANASRVVGFLADSGYEMLHVESYRPVDPSTSARAMEGHVYCT